MVFSLFYHLFVTSSPCWMCCGGCDPQPRSVPAGAFLVQGRALGVQIRGSSCFPWPLATSPAQPSLQSPTGVLFLLLFQELSPYQSPATFSKAQYLSSSGLIQLLWEGWEGSSEQSWELQTPARGWHLLQRCWILNLRVQSLWKTSWNIGVHP